MSLQVCLACATVENSASRCPSCGGALVTPSRSNLQALLDAKVRVQIDAWEREGIVDGETSSRLRGAAGLGAGQGASAPEGPPRESVLEALARRQREVSARWQALVVAVETDRGADGRTPAGEGAAGAGGDTRDAIEAGRQLFGGARGTEVGGGLEALADLDDHGAPSSHESPLGSLFAEYAWWFLGTLLVLAGSVMGVREAWRALAGPPRQIVVAGALFVYHALFLGLAAVVARRSALAGRALASIAVGLLPIVFVALAALVEGSRGPGLALAGLTLALSAVSLTSAGKRFSGASSRTLALVVLPSLAAEVLVGFTTSIGIRVAAPFVGVAAAAFAGARLVRGQSLAAGVASFVAALYGAVALGLFALLGAPGSASVPLPPGSMAHATVILFFLALSWVLAETVSRGPVPGGAPRLAPLLEVVALAGLGLASCVGARAALGTGASLPEPGADRAASFVLASLPGLGAAGFALASSRHRAALHPAVLLGVGSAFLLGRAALPSDPSMGFVAAAVASSLLVLASRFAPATRTLLELWGGGLGLLSVGLAATSATTTDSALVDAAIAGGALALAAHAAGGLERARMHGLGALASLLAASVLIVPNPGRAGPARFIQVCAALSALYGVAALGHAAFLGRRERDHGERPLDDASLVLALLGALVSCVALPVVPDLAGLTHGASPRSVLETLAPFTLPGLCVAAVLAARSLRDRSRLVSFVAMLVVGSALSSALGVAQGAALSLSMGIAAALATALASARGALVAPAEPSRGRLFAGVLPLPFGARGSDLLDGVAAAALVFVPLSVLATVGWLGHHPEMGRSAAVVGSALSAGALALAFVSQSHSAFFMRGSIVTLSALGALGALAGVANRVGRPLAPAVVGVRISLMAIAAWILARLLHRFGPRIARGLGRPEDGLRYHLVAHAGVLALGGLLAVDAVLVGGPTLPRALLITPPTMLLGAALASLLLFRSFCERKGAGALLHGAVGLLLLSAPVLAVRRGLLGPELVPLVPPGGRWVLVGTEAMAGASWLDPALFLPSGETLSGLFGRAWSGLLAFASISAALAALVHRSSAARRRVAGGALGLEPDGDGRRVPGVLVTGVAVATGVAALGGFSQPALDRPQVAGILIVGALTFGATSVRGRGDVARGLGALSVVLAGLSAFVLACALSAGALPALQLGVASPLTAARTALSALDAAAAVALFGPLLALALTSVATLAHGASVLGEARRPEAAWGASAGRDILLVATLVLLAWLAASGAPPPGSMAPAGVALGLLAAISIHALVRARTARHAYMLQIAVVAAYALLRVGRPSLPPLLDALAALAYGFVLVGATTLARRLDVPPVAAATRRFAAALPVLVALLRSDGAALDSALVAAGASVLYGALAAADRSRIFGALAALAANVALLYGALALGRDGVEAYLGPLGILLVTLGQIFSSKLEPAGRTALRIVGSLLLYAPAAMKLTFRLGQASDGTYSVLFGALCLLGIVVGMVLRIRAYLVIGTLFVTLDVVANLVFAGLRDHRIGFVILSVSGLGILAAMIGTTLRRDEVRRWVGRVRGALRGWE